MVGLSIFCSPSPPFTPLSVLQLFIYRNNSCESKSNLTQFCTSRSACLFILLYESTLINLPMRRQCTAHLNSPVSLVLAVWAVFCGHSVRFILNNPRQQILLRSGDWQNIPDCFLHTFQVVGPDFWLCPVSFAALGLMWADSVSLNTSGFIQLASIFCHIINKSRNPLEGVHAISLLPWSVAS